MSAGHDTPSVAVKMIFFGHDCTESTVIKRARSFMAHGFALTGFMFRRAKLNRDFRPAWPNVELGVTSDRSYGRRLLAMVRAIPVMVRNRALLRPADAIYARNVDMCLLAMAARVVARRRIPIVYEVLDVHRLFTAPGRTGAVLRWCERRLLARIDLLVVSSPGYVDNYFDPVQRYRGPWFLLENKVLLADRPMPEPAADRPVAPGGRWRIGWFGSLRCEESLRLLAALADRLPDRVDIVLRGGWPHDLGRDGLDAILAGRPNMRHEGEYRSPDDLRELYEGVDLYWGLDFHEKGANSLWLLPNRLYEGGLFGAVAIAAEGTEMGRRVAGDGIGFVFEAPYDRSVAEFLERLDREEFRVVRDRVLAMPRSSFVETGDSARLCSRIRGLTAAQAGTATLPEGVGRECGVVPTRPADPSTSRRGYP